MAPVVAAIATAAAGVSQWYGTLTAVQAAVVQLAASTAMTAAGIAFRRAPEVEAAKARLAMPNGLPSKRYVYGRYRTEGAPAPYRVREGKLWICYILNSRPSVGGPVSIWIDKRLVTFSGDLFNFAGDGAVATNPVWVRGFGDYLVRCWIGLGGQPGPPARILSQAPELFLPTDRWEGRTVLWMELIAGGERNRARRWKRVPPHVEVEMNWSAVWDPRDPAQAPDAPETWLFSANPALQTLDALRNNPIARYRLRQLHLDSWADKADIDDQTMPLRDGGAHSRYSTAGVIDWSSGEIEQLIEPILLSSLGGVTRVGGRLAAIPGIWQEPEVVLPRMVKGQDLVVHALQPGDGIFSAVKTTYIEPAQDWKPADAGVYVVPGAADEDGGLPQERSVHLSWCTDAVQAQRIGQALARIGRRQRQLSGQFAPEAIEAVAGGTVALDFPAEYAPLSGNYVVETTTPGMDLLGSDGGAALRCPMVLRAGGPEDYAWNPATDQRDVLVVPPVTGFAPELAMPGVIEAVSGSVAALGTGGAAIPRIRFAFDPADSDRVDGYEWVYRLSGGSWTDGGRIRGDVRDSSGKVFGYLHPVLVGEVYDIGVWSRGNGDESERRIYTGAVALPADVVLTPPTITEAAGAAGSVTLTIRTPNARYIEAVRVYSSATTDPLSAVEITAEPIAATPNWTFNFVDAGVTPGVWHYWARIEGPYGALSALSARVSATAT